MRSTKSIAERILELGNFLGESKTAEEIKKEIKEKTGYNLKLQDIRVNLLYLLRRGKLKRIKEKDKEYKYRI